MANAEERMKISEDDRGRQDQRRGGAKLLAALNEGRRGPGRL